MQSSDINHDTIDLLPYARILLARWRTITLAMAATSFLTILLTTLTANKWYRAIAILKPTPRASMINRMAGVPVPDIASLAALTAGHGADEAEEYRTILESFVFTAGLVKRHRLEETLLAQSSAGIWSFLLVDGPEDGDPSWRAYREMRRRFSCDYSPRTGNITLFYQDRSVDAAQMILTYYVDDLRDKLRQREVQDASGAIDSMKAEARSTSDYLLQTQLYELIARQTQQLKLAQVEADFAFAVLEPPVAPHRAYRPRVALDCSIAAILAAVTASFVILIAPEWRPGCRRVTVGRTTAEGRAAESV